MGSWSGVELNDVMEDARIDAMTPSPWDAAADAHERWRNGEPRALDDLVRVLTPILWHAARSYGLAVEAAQDVVQTAWLRFVRSPAQVRDSQAIGGWMLTTTRRIAWRVTRTREIPVDECPPAASPPTPEDEVIAGYEATALWNAVASLDARCQRLLRIIAFDDRPNYAALSAETGMPVGSIGPTRRRCLVKLRRLLEGNPA